MEDFDERIVKENENLIIELKNLQKQYEMKKENFVKEEIRYLDNQVLSAKKKSEKKDQENLISFLDSKKETKTYNKSKLFKSFLQHHDEKLQNCEESIKDSLEDLERNINNFKDDFKKVLEKQQDLLLIANNDGLNNLLVDFKQFYK